MYRRKTTGLFVTIVLALSFFGNIFADASDETDRIDCKNIQCQPIQCPDDSEAIYVQHDGQQRNDNANYRDTDYGIDEANNVDETLIGNTADDNNYWRLDNDSEDIRAEHQNRRHIDNFYVEPSEKAAENRTSNITKRSLQYKRRESIKIVPGDYISLVPDVGHYHNAEHQINHGGKWKREDSMPPAALEASTKLATKNLTEDNSSSQQQCCPAQKCICKDTCDDIPVCPQTTDVLLETEPAHRDRPGECCPTYECIAEPDCRASNATNITWIETCRSCQCLLGNKICHNTCGDEDESSPKTCFSAALNKLYFDGNTWLEDECTVCECQAGDRKCVTNFCRSLECRHKIKIPGECCPVCVPNTTSTEAVATEQQTIASGTTEHTVLSSSSSSATKPTTILAISSPLSTLSTMSTSTEIDIPTTSSSSASGERSASSPSEANSEKVDYEIIFLYIAVPTLSFLCILFAILWWRLKNQKKSYGPVPSFDSNLNRVPSPINTA